MNYTTTKIDDLIKKVSENFKNGFIAGSFSLNYFGYISRPIGDLDICVPIKYTIDGTEFFNNLKHGILAKFRMEKPNGNHLKMTIDGVDICIFFVNEYKCFEVPYNGMTIRVGFAEYAIRAKEKYLDGFDSGYATGNELSIQRKHKEDVKAYNNNKLAADRAIKIREMNGDIKLIDIP